MVIQSDLEIEATPHLQYYSLTARSPVEDGVATPEDKLFPRISGKKQYDLIFRKINVN